MPIRWIKKVSSEPLSQYSRIKSPGLPFVTMPMRRTTFTGVMSPNWAISAAPLRTPSMPAFFTGLHATIIGMLFRRCFLVWPTPSVHFLTTPKCPLPSPLFFTGLRSLRSSSLGMILSSASSYSVHMPLRMGAQSTAEALLPIAKRPSALDRRGLPAGPCSQAVAWHSTRAPTARRAFSHHCRCSNPRSGAVPCPAAVEEPGCAQLRGLRAPPPTTPLPLHHTQ
mmetsp:Transcript_10492/g.26958  ORF Transcript_10492/g.26958 Transcript_10492/m.26958 type:complete len:224 (-) Transcript_10492:129-800(-)